MQYRALGNTGLEVPVLSFGASSVGSVFREVDPAEGIRTVHTAIEVGMNLIDVSPYYGLTKAETVLGAALRELPRDAFILSSKAGRYGENTFDYSYERILSSVDESLQRLHTDYLDILLLHDFEFVPWRQVEEEALPALGELKRQGKIRFGGLSALPLAAFKKALMENRPDVDVILSYCHYSLNDSTLLDLVPLLEARQIGLMNASPLSMGLLSQRGTASWHPADEELKQVCLEAAAYCSAQGTDIAKLAVQYATRDERIPTTLVSSASEENIRRNAAWVEEPLDEQLLAEVLAILAPVQGRTWPSGRAEYNEAEQGGEEG
ncbi:aldo/keto reductase [Paenibacillus daejeonensis]|uniref:aldo/keto reductase n=1 Tax=Paenibacillus daejeonensis TaxID=135193 RepID=UPI00037E068E|nr:aldo/keto reductase [Paenibacillus daejeonensis]